MTLVEDMLKLSEDIQIGWDTRMTAIAGIRLESAQQIHDLGEARIAMARGQSEQLRREASTRRRDVVTMLNEQGQSRMAMASDQRARFSSELARLAAEGAAGRQARQADTKARQAELAASHGHWASGAAAMSARRRRGS